MTRVLVNDGAPHKIWQYLILVAIEGTRAARICGSGFRWNTEGEREGEQWRWDEGRQRQQQRRERKARAREGSVVPRSKKKWIQKVIESIVIQLYSLSPPFLEDK